ncbi:MAG: hypothetical protein IPH62_11805 [Ignavibacteriae bacterium]|nr:hypothetical protein [Ignavibacteriota bacterium]
MKTQIVLFILGLIFSKSILAQNNISLLDAEKVKDYLILNQKQFEDVSQKIKLIETIIEKDENVISTIKLRVKNGDVPGFFEKIGVKRGHDNRESRIEDLVDEIEDRLTEQQKIKFMKIEKPKLKVLKKEDVFGK